MSLVRFWLFRLLLLAGILLSFTFHSSADYLTWDANSEPNLAGYKVYWGNESRNYIGFVDVGNVTEYHGGLDNQTYYAVTAYNDNVPYDESGYSNEVYYLADNGDIYPATGGSINYEEIYNVATITVDTDGVSGDYSNLNDALSAVPSPLTEDYMILCSASTSVKDTVNADGIIINTTSLYRLTIKGTNNYIYSPSNEHKLCFIHSTGIFVNVTIDGVNFEKLFMNDDFQPILDIGSIREGNFIIKNCRFIGDETITHRERLLVLGLDVRFGATISVVNNYFRTKGSSTAWGSACILHKSDAPAFLYNNTFIGFRASHLDASNALYINNIINTTVSGGNVSLNSDYNMFSGAFDFGGLNDEQEQNFTFVDLVNDDVHLDMGDTGARGKGLDLSADSNFAFDYDQDGTMRSAWDAGAFEYQ